MKCDECGAPATRVAFNDKSNQCRALCKRDSKALPNSDTTRKSMKPLWKITKISLGILQAKKEL